ncbi:Biopolymer transporter TonB [Sphingobium herbicidovorans NBRC 16415]|uniref:Protein TonB n=1 Tax=Sphingobium herbicidovorans (strain ATCC 700291 / DSM 11019 / CCUG 56400 / KCTC 2939 / LMG 18315 / NBRC 16415 / MH) TaxID=1219045 RepID=A0A086P4W9_SPHHM|nr:energy transducer TonB [Sphingobium herbicidovorans]KFG88437.1 Biopolymer transporter TonB [Sphingobium herbicidovorans NBRC 16415]
MTFMTAHAMGAQQQSGYSGKSGSPVGIGATIAVHAVVVGAFILMPREVIAPYVPQILIGSQIPLDPPPPPENQPSQPQSKLPVRAKADPGPTKPDSLVNGADNGSGLVLTGNGGAEGFGGEEMILSPLDPPREPVMVEPGIDPKALAAFQPDYPGTMIRQGIEGSVTVCVTISAQGRVIDIERLAATDEAFWLATQRHALRKWRFHPATRDGVAVSGAKVLTIYFRLTDR